MDNLQQILSVKNENHYSKPICGGPDTSPKDLVKRIVHNSELLVYAKLLKYLSKNVHRSPILANLTNFFPAHQWCHL